MTTISLTHRASKTLSSLGVDVEAILSRPYYLGNPRVSSGYMTPREVAHELRHVASLIPDSLPRAEDRKVALRQRAADIDAGQHNPTRHFTVFIPVMRKGKRKAVTLPCSGFSLYTFDEAWLILETYAARRGWGTEAHAAMDCWAEGRGQNMALDYIYDGIAEPMREVPPV